MNVLHISSSDTGGGAAIAAMRLQRGLRKAGVLSKMAVAERSGGDPDVLAMPQPTSLGDRIWRRLDQFRLILERRRSSTLISPALDYFSDDRVPGPDLLANLPAADVLHLHWVANFVDYTRLFYRLRPGQPLVWTLHDMNPFTGGCHYTMGCEQFLTGCGACPLLGSIVKSDITRKIFARKREALARLDARTTCIVAPSRWLAEVARRSPLLGRFRIEVVPNGLDTEVFRSREKQMAREVFGLPQDRPVLLLISDNLQNHRKGLDLLQSALAQISKDDGITLATIGTGTHGLIPGIVSLGRIDSERLMSFAYSAADVFVLPTRADNLPNVLVEAIASGTPSISFRVGGVPDVVRHGQTGLLAEPEDIASLRQCIVALLKDEEMRASMSRNCREISLTEYSDVLIARKYVAIYEELIEASMALSHNFKQPAYS